MAHKCLACGAPCDGDVCDPSCAAALERERASRDQSDDAPAPIVGNTEEP